jgi:RNA polymerase sigma-70 factor (ECF subfamily)
MRAAVLTIWSRAIPIPDAAEDLDALVREHATFVFKVAYAVLRNHHDAEDAVQETFLRVWRQRREWSEVRDPRAWLARIAWRVAVSRRKTSPEISLDAAAAAVAQLRAAGASVEELAGRAEMAALLERLMASLPRELREPLLLSTVEEMGSAGIGAVLDIPDATVRTRLARARQLLREKLAGVLAPPSAGQEGKHGR